MHSRGSRPKFGAADFSKVGFIVPKSLLAESHQTQVDRQKMSLLRERLRTQNELAR